MPTQRLKEFLDSHHIHYESVPHPTAYTAQRTAESAHIRGKELAKTVMVKIDEKMAMAVVPASYRVDLDLLKQATGAKSVELATEKQFQDMFPECEVGAMPPFGNLYDMEVFASPRLMEDEEIAFNAGSHTELIRLSYKDYAELVSPAIVKLSPSDPG
ncbi:MAG: YbaK/EbsC family protein [Gammaproteobacteria bacterium]|nr:YbaK/EbsC family protein [Gammaproteobacteria bacterium]